MRQTKKILSLFLSLVMVFAVSAIQAMAENNATIVGVGTIIAPPAGTMSVLPIKILDAEGNALADPTLAITDSNVKGVYKSGSNILVDGDEITAGTFTLTATSGDVTASKTVTVSDTVWYEDFEDVTIPTTEGETVSATASMLSKIDGTQSTASIVTGSTDSVVLAENGKQYASAKAITMPTASISDVPTVITIEALVRNPGYTPIKIGRFSNNTYTIDKTGTNNNGYMRLYNTTHSGGLGSTAALATTYASVLNGSDDNIWVNVRVEIDSVNGAVNYYEKGTKILSSSEFPAMTMKRLQDIVWTSEIDEIRIYTGKSGSSSSLGSISGADKIAAPGIGEYSKYDEYKVLSAEGTEIENAVLTYSGNIPGVKFENGALLVNGSTVRAGSFTLTATKADGELIAKKQIEILPDRYAEDFDDVTVGEEAVEVTDTKLAMLDGTTSENSIATSGKVTTNGSTNCATSASMALNTTPFANANILTIKLKAQKASDSQYLASFKTDDNKTFSIRYYSNGYLYLQDDNDKTGYDLGIGTSTENLFDVKIVFDFVKHTITVNGKSVAPGNFANSKSLASFSTLQNQYVDDVSYFTGKEVSLTATSGRLTIPTSGETSYPVTATYSDGTTATITSITENYDGITTDGGNIKVSSTALVQPYTFTVSDGFMSADVTFQADKDFVLLNGSVFNNEKLAEGSNTVSAAYGASDLAAGRRLIIAHYGADENGNVQLKNINLSEVSSASVKEITASLTDDVAEGDIIRIFKWIWNTLVPINSVTID